MSPEPGPPLRSRGRLRAAAWRIGRAGALAALVALLVPLAYPVALPAQGRGTAPRWVGLSLSEALDELRARGLRIVYSSDLVRPEMTVRLDPGDGPPHEILRNLLGPHGLAAEVGPGGTVLVVTRQRTAILVSILRPGSGQAVFGRVELAAEVFSDEPLDRVEFYVDGALEAQVRRPPWSVTLDVGEDNRDRRFEVVARGRWGGVGRAAVATHPVEIVAQLEVALHQVFVTASRGGEPVRDLPRERFRLVDDGHREELVTFERGDVPITAVLLLDASESMAGPYLEGAIQGARTFLGETGPLDEAMILLFSDRPLAATPFSNDRDELLAGLGGAVAQGGTALNDHLYASLRLLDGVQGRRVVVLFSDGTDVQSILSMREVLWKVRRSNATIYWVRLDRGDPSSLSSAWRDFQSSEAEWKGLAEAVEESGGRTLVLDDIDQADGAFSEVMAELRGQYVLGYYPTEPRRDGSWRPLRISVDGLEVKLRYRGGYVDE